MKKKYRVLETISGVDGTLYKEEMVTFENEETDGDWRVKDNMGRIWFLGTTDLHEMPLKVFRHAKICLAFLVKNYEEVENFVPYDHWENIAWLVKLGFKVEKTPYYLDDHHFYRVFYCNFQKTDTKIDKSRPIMH